MTNLSREYFKRHSMNVIPVANEGLIFFDKPESNPAMVCLISSAGKNLTNCASCLEDNKNNLIVEFFKVLELECNYLCYDIICHTHVNPECNLLQLMQEQGLHDYEPVYMGDYREVELWLWNWFKQTQKKLFSKNNLIKNKELSPHEKMIEEMALLLNSNAKSFSIYYQCIYQTFCLGRKYLLL